MKKMVHAKQRTNNLPARHLGQSCTSSRGTYVLFEKVGRLFLVGSNNVFESTEFTGSRETGLIKACKIWMPGVSRWAYNQLQHSKLRKFGPEIVVEQQETKPTPSSTDIPQEISAPILKTPTLFNPKDIKVFYYQGGGRTTVMVLLMNSKPSEALVFQIYMGKVVKKSASKGQNYSLEYLESKESRWLKGNLGQPQFVSILELIKSEVAAEDTSKQKAA